jgi:RND family efflux transporter MFP subunit
MARSTQFHKTAGRLAGAMLLFLASSCGKSEAPAALPASPPAEAVPTTTETQAPTPAPSLGSVAAEDRLFGSLEPHRRAQITPRVPGVVTKVLVSEGDRVKKGDALVHIDLRDFELRVRDAEAARDAASSGAENARLELKRYQSLVADNAVPQGRFDAIAAAARGAEAQLGRAEAQADLARKALADAVVRAPFDAVVTERLVDEGEYATVTPAKPLVTVEETGIIDLRVMAPERLVGAVRVGDKVRASFTAKGRTIEVAVTRVVPSLDPKTRTFLVIAEIDNTDGSLEPGLFADVLFETRGTAPAAATP